MDPRERSDAARGRTGPLVLVPGWSHGGHAFDPLRAALGGHRPITALDLPGTGAHWPDRCGADLDAVADALRARAPSPAVWLGWSLGGLVALRVAQRWPEHVVRVVLLASSPRFTAAPGWPGMDAQQLARFIDAVDTDPAAARDRFLGLQLAPGHGQRRALASLRRVARRDGLPAAATLRAGLEVLRDTDLRDGLATLACPIDAILAESDPLVPVALAPALRARGVRVWTLEGLGHAPLIPAPERVAATLEDIERDPSTRPAR